MGRHVSGRAFRNGGGYEPSTRTGGDSLGAEKQGILAELTVFDDEEGETLRKLRRFFTRFGYQDVDCALRIGGAPVDLMVKPIRGTAEIAPIAPRVLADLYSRCLRPAGIERMLSFGPAE